jgi:tetratricopeptide (TPR) repeat protein
VKAPVVRGLGLVVTLAYAAFAVWLYVVRPQSFSELKGGVAASVGLYQVDAALFEEGRRLLRADHLPEARAAFERADPARRDATTQFYIAYTFYRQGWGRVYNDDALFTQAMQALDRVAALSPDAPVRVSDPNLGLPSSDALREEVRQGLTLETADFNPLRVFRKRQ